MRAIIKRGIVASLVLVGILVASHLAGAPAEPPATVSAAAPARADLAEAVYAMVAARAAEAGLPQPVTLCQACLAAHLDLPDGTVRERCGRACGLRCRIRNEQQ